MDRGGEPPLFPFTITSSSSSEGLLLYLQYYRRWEQVIFKMQMKSKFVLQQLRYDNLLTQKKIRKFMFLKYSFSWKRTVNVNLKNLNFWGHFTLSNLIILLEDLIRWKRSFDIFLIDHYAGDIENKSIAGKY